MTPAEAELAVLVPELRYVLLKGDLAVAVHPLSWGKELRYRRELSTAVRKLDGDGMTGIARIIAGCSDTVITALVCDLTHENRAFVEEHVEASDRLVRDARRGIKAGLAKVRAIK